ncbi:MAG: enoyl-CoA hydratase/isomerase family protein [Sphingomonas sp.]
MSPYLKNYEKLFFDFPADRVLRITMGDPEKLTTVCGQTHLELVNIWKDIDDDEEISAVILTGGKKAFSAGGDFSIVERSMTDYHFRNQIWKETRNLVYNIVNCNKPIISAMRGPAVGAGLVCGLLADISIASKNARLIDGHTRLGVAAGDHSVIIWPLLCGMAKAKYYLLTCDVISGEEAERIGLISLTCDDDQLDDKALEVAVRLSKGAPSAIRWTKSSLNNWLRMMGPSFDASLAYEMLGLTGPEVLEGVASHREKRPPVFDQTCKV